MHKGTAKGNKSKRGYKEEYESLLSKNYNTELKLTEKQKQLYDIIKDNTITFVTGCWGTAKTFTSCHSAYKLLESGDYRRIVITKPIVEAGENIGFLKGDLDEKIAPYSESYWETFAKISNEFFAKELRETNQVKFAPIAYMRGNNFDKDIIIVDEAQNLSEKQLMLVITRLGKGSKMIIVGDKNQTDIPDKHSGLTTFLHILKGVDSIGFFEFNVEDIMREPILIEISKRYEEWKYNVAGSEVKRLMND